MGDFMLAEFGVAAGYTFGRMMDSLGNVSSGDLMLYFGVGLGAVMFYLFLAR